MKLNTIKNDDDLALAGTLTCETVWAALGDPKNYREAFSAAIAGPITGQERPVEATAHAAVDGVLEASIPDGWHIEPSAYGPDISHVVWPGHGAASISWRRRSVALGWCIPPPVCDDVRPKGRRWREKLMEAAIDLLRKS